MFPEHPNLLIGQIVDQTDQPDRSAKQTRRMREMLKSYLFSLLFLVGLAGCQKQETPSPVSKQDQVRSEDRTGADEAVGKEKTAKADGKSPETRSIEYINPLTEQQMAQGWINLFDGQSLFGWKPQNAVNWSVQDRQITASKGPIGLLLTRVRFADFKLVLDYRLSEGGNSGVFIRCAKSPTDPKLDCYEINLADSHPEGYLTGSFVGLHRFDPGKPTADGKWHQLQITADGNSFVVLIDGKMKTEFRDDRKNWLRSGLIGLQKNSGEIAFRNIRLKPLNQRELFNGKDLSGWREVPGSKSHFEVVDGTIHVTNGPGFLETEKTFENFILQFQAKTNAPELNSGLFFRAMEGTEKAPSNGYEVQIHNGFKDGDRNKPNNAGTGAIFRRVNARRVVSSDNKWCTITLIADGPHISTWVDGYQVVDWEDTRKPDPNPRRGKRLEAGHLSLQGHDPTTDLSFKKIEISLLP